MRINLKRIGRWGLLAVGTVALWSLSPMWKGVVQTEQAFAQTQINKFTPFNFTLQTYYDVSSSVNVSAGGYGGPGHSGGAGDALLRILNVGNFTTPIDGVPAGGQAAPAPIAGPPGAVCANIYVFDDIQELEECCSCPLSADKVLTLSTISDLTSNPLFKNAKMSLGTIKIIGCNDTPVCFGAFPASTGHCLGAHGLKGWLSHAETIASNLPPSFGFTTSTSVDELASVPLDTTEGEDLALECHFAATQGSGAGICDCGAGETGIVAAPGSQSSSQQSDSVSPRPFSR